MSSDNQLAGATGFGCNVLAGSLCKEIQREAVATRGLLCQTAQSLVQFGFLLQIVKDLLGWNQFQSWLAVEFEWSVSTASRYMRVAKLFGDLTCLNYFQPSALHALAQHRVEGSIRKLVIERAERGEFITKAKVDEMLDR